MTGFGDATARDAGVQYTLEIRSVNNKYLKTIVRVPERLAVLEPVIESHLRRRLARGTVTVTLSCAEIGEAAAHQLNAEALTRYVRQLGAIEGIDAAKIDPGSLLALPGVLTPPAEDGSKTTAARAAIEPLLAQATDHLVSMRTREGLALREDLVSHHDLIADRLEKIRVRAPEVVEEYQRRLKSRLEALLAEFDVRSEPADLIREVAVYAEKTDIAEEVARLTEHLRHFRELLDSEDDRPIGRTLDFLAQELLREANTISSKSPDAEASRLCVEIKGAIDRIKEQVQNAE
ncbi:MAG: YicC family protein [Phycisphaeraceae bacterium]|nr:MAG: YicC family protein [Phycisphaeraceae bacterium]